MTGIVGSVARDNAGGAPGNLDDKSMDHRVCYTPFTRQPENPWVI
jgi:hypothetical protein